MSEYPKQIEINDPLWAFMQHGEVYCSGACCGIQAFEVHPALLLRKVIDENLAGRNGSEQFKIAWQQLADLIRFVELTNLVSVNGELPFWNEERTELPQYWLPEEEVPGWLERWNDAFAKASKYGGLDGS
ncbi:DUF6331 family protein [Thermodesulfobacteriota bacterium]